MSSVAVLIHGCHLRAETWQNIVFGNDKELGRVPTALQIAVSEKADLIFWGSGASETVDGIKESQYIFDQTLGPELQNLARRVDRQPVELITYLKRVSHIDLVTQNTADEIRVAAELCAKQNISKLILVSSPTHLPRCIKEACMYRNKHPELKLTFYGTPSDTCFAHATPSDTVIVEPPHRGDLPKGTLYKTLSKIFPIMRNPDKAEALQKGFENVIEGLKEVP